MVPEALGVIGPSKPMYPRRSKVLKSTHTLDDTKLDAAAAAPWTQF
jgi:hypothetical protein